MRLLSDQGFASGHPPLFSIFLQPHIYKIHIEEVVGKSNPALHLGRMEGDSLGPPYWRVGVGHFIQDPGLELTREVLPLYLDLLVPWRLISALSGNTLS
jgi:hypothetical protein